MKETVVLAKKEYILEDEIYTPIVKESPFERQGGTYRLEKMEAGELELEKTENYVIPLAIRLQFEFSGRRSEICPLEWDWLDFERWRVV